MNYDATTKFYLVDQIEMEAMLKILATMSEDIVELTEVIEALTQRCKEMEQRIDALEHKQREDGK